MMGVLSEKECMVFLKSNYLGRIGCTHNGDIYIVPVNYIINAGSIIIHSPEGRKVKMMRKNPRACFQVDEIKTFTRWKSVIAWGNYEEITDEKEKWNALESFVSHFIEAKVTETTPSPEVSEVRVHPRSYVKMVVFKININKITGRFETDE